MQQEAESHRNRIATDAPSGRGLRSTWNRMDAGGLSAWSSAAW